MRHHIRSGILVAFAATSAFAEEAPAGFSAGPRLGFGSWGLPGIATGPLAVDFGVVLQKPLSRSEALLGGIEYQRVPQVFYERAPRGPYGMGLLSGFVGWKTTLLPRSRIQPYVAPTVGFTRWSGRPGDTGLSPTLGWFVGTQMNVGPRARVFAEFGGRYGLGAVPGSVPHWGIGFGYTRAF